MVSHVLFPISRACSQVMSIHIHSLVLPCHTHSFVNHVRCIWIVCSSCFSSFLFWFVRSVFLFVVFICYTFIAQCPTVPGTDSVQKTFKDSVRHLVWRIATPSRCQRFWWECVSSWSLSCPPHISLQMTSLRDEVLDATLRQVKMSIKCWVWLMMSCEELWSCFLFSFPFSGVCRTRKKRRLSCLEKLWHFKMILLVIAPTLWPGGWFLSDTEHVML